MGNGEREGEGEREERDEERDVLTADLHLLLQLRCLGTGRRWKGSSWG